MRLTRLINSDTILDAPRIALARKFGAGSTVVYFLNCPWCVGMWLSLLSAPAVVVVLGWPWWALIPTGLACSQIVGMAAPLYNEDEIEFESVESD